MPERPVSGRERKRQKPAFAELPPRLKASGEEVGEAKPESGKRMEGERIAAALTRAVQARVTDSGGPSRSRVLDCGQRAKPNRRDPAASLLRAPFRREEEERPVRGRARRDSGGQWPEPGLSGAARRGSAEPGAGAVQQAA